MSSRRKSLNIPDSPRMRIFRAIDDRIRTDSVISRIVRPSSIRSWRGDPSDRHEFGISHAPAIRLTPHPGPETWQNMIAIRGLLLIDVEILVAGSCVDDLDNLWQAIYASINPTGILISDAFSETLRSIGAWQGIVNVTQAVFDHRAESGTDGMFRGTGQLSVDYQYTP